MNKYNNTYHSTMKMKPAHVKNNFNICFDKESNDKDPKSTYGHHVRILKFKNIFAKIFTQN